MSAILLVKTTYLKKIAWLLIGLAITSEDRGREIGKDALAQYDGASEHEHHRISNKLLKRASSFRPRELCGRATTIVTAARRASANGCLQVPFQR